MVISVYFVLQPHEHLHAWEPGERSTSSVKHDSLPLGASMFNCKQPPAGPQPAAPSQNKRPADLPEQAMSSTTARPWASYVPHRLREFMSSSVKGEGIAGLTQTQAAAAAAGAVVLLYAGALRFTLA